MYILYNLILSAAALVGVPYYLLKMLITGKYRKSFIPKLGGGEKKAWTGLKNVRRVWVHAVSVGEVTAAVPIVASLKKIRPDVEIIVSTSTETGQEMARSLVKGASDFIYFPLDIPWVVQRVIRKVGPDVFAMVETELWPNFLKTCRSAGVKSLMVNGRISPRSFRRYKLTKFFWRLVLSNVDAASMISAIDAERLAMIGMPSGKIQIMGNAKYDSLAAMVSPQLREEVSILLGVQEKEKFLVAGSTHQGEEEVIISVYREIIKNYPDFRLIIVPRHVERAKEITELLQRSNFTDIINVSAIKKGKKRRDERIIIVDVIGELFKVYSLATIVYCGGSLVPKGGQNILEAAAWGKIVFYGPSMEDFSDEKNLLESVGAGTTINNAAELLQGINRVLQCPQELEQRGVRGAAIVRANMGAATGYAELINKYLN